MRLSALAVVVGALLVGSVAKAENQVGAETETDKVAGVGIVFGTGPDTVGLQGNGWFGIPAVRGLRVGGDVVIYLPYEEVNVDLFFLTINPGAQYVFDIPGVPVRPYAEAGLAIAFARASFPGGGSDTNTELGLNLGGGVEYDAGFARIYGMLRYQFLGDNADQLELGGGLRWAF